MAQFEARTSTAGGRAVVTLVGECDLAVRDEVTSVLLAALDGAGAVDVDLAGLRFMDSSGVHALVTAHHAAVSKGRRLSVTNAKGPVARVLDLTGLGDLLRPGADGPGPGHG